MMLTASYIPPIVKSCNYDYEEALLTLYYTLKKTNFDAFHHQRLVSDYNAIVKTINEKDPHKHFREVEI